MYACVCVCMNAGACVCVCVCVCPERPKRHGRGCACGGRQKGYVLIVSALCAQVNNLPLRMGRLDLVDV